MVLRYNSFVGQWVEVKKKDKNQKGQHIIWKGKLESVSDNGFNLGNGQSSAGGFSEVTTVPWTEIVDLTLQQGEAVDYFVGG